MLESFDSRDIPHDGVTLRVRSAGNGPPLLLLHGHPQTHAMWHRVAPTLTKRFTVVAMDLRGRGDSTRPPASASHMLYSKRAMAGDALAVMRSLGFEKFAVCAHDRGARVAHRLALDHESAVSRLMLLDIAPTLAMYEGTTEAFARAYWHWFFLIRPAPLPERLIGAEPRLFLRHKMSDGRLGIERFTPQAWAEYERCFTPGVIHASCEDYRAAAGIDLEHDRADRAAGLKLACPVLALWGGLGVVERCFKPLDEWRRVADDVRGRALPCGHYLPEEQPELVTQELENFIG